jgi:Zn-dependent peptidase ImmA (M78 family)/transcriptional regulator with XRE-family HTH domain
MDRALIGANLRHARQSLRLSQTTVASELGLSRQALSATESGKRAITVEELLQLANLYRLSPEVLLKSSAKPSREHFGPIQHRANASGAKPIDDHDAMEIASFIDSLRTRRGALPHSVRPVGSARPTFRQLSKVADELREQIGLRTPPINVYKALSDLGLFIRMTSLNNISGAFIAPTKQRAAGVLINSSQPPHRQRFSAAHELGHCVLGHADQGTEEIISPLGRRFAPHETEADAFASDLLVPLPLLTREIDNLRGYDRSDELVYHLADRFLVSYQAMVYRLANLTAITPTQKDQLLKIRPSEIEARVKLKQKVRKRFDPLIVKKSIGNFPEPLLREPDGVRQLQELAFEEYARQVPEIERADSAAQVYERVAIWIAETYPLAS